MSDCDEANKRNIIGRITHVIGKILRCVLDFERSDMNLLTGV